MQASGKGLNVKEMDKEINALMPKLSPYGTGVRKDGKGGFEYFNITSGKLETTEEVNAKLEAAREKAKGLN